MESRWRTGIIGVAAASSLVCIGVGLATIRSQRPSAAAGGDTVVASPLTGVDQPTPTTRDAAASLVSERLARMDAAIVRADTRTAIRAWHEAYAAALLGQGWRNLIQVGDAALRLSAGTGGSRGTDERARRAYLAALTRARQAESSDGVRKATEGLAAAGDSVTALNLRGLEDRRANRSLTPVP